MLYFYMSQARYFLSVADADPWLAQGCQISIFRANFRNLVSFEVGWPKQF